MQQKYLNVRIHHGNKTKICIFEAGMTWKTIQPQIVDKFASLQNVSNEWHLEYDYGTWIEDSNDWEIAVIYHMHKGHNYNPFELFIVFGNDVVGGKAKEYVQPAMKRAKLNDGKSQDKDNVNAVIPPPTCPKYAIHLNDEESDDFNNQGMNVDNIDSNVDGMDKLWINIKNILKTCHQPVNVLWLRRKFSGSLPNVGEMNKVLYEQLRRGNLIKYPSAANKASQKPLWSLSPMY